MGVVCGGCGDAGVPDAGTRGVVGEVAWSWANVRTHTGPREARGGWERSRAELAHSPPMAVARGRRRRGDEGGGSTWQRGKARAHVSAGAGANTRARLGWAKRAETGRGVGRARGKEGWAEGIRPEAKLRFK